MVSHIYRVIEVTCVISRYLFTHKFYNEKKKKPDLQLKILKELTNHESLSKSKAKNEYLKEHHYGEISEAFDNLLKKKLIEPKCVDTSRSGKPEKFYNITYNGLAAIVSDETNPENFWSYIIRVCHYRSDPIDLQTVNDLYELFISKYLKYASGREAGLFLDELNDFYAKWLSAQKINESSLITRILEILVSYPNITKEEISSKLMGVSNSDLDEILLDFSTGPIQDHHSPADSWKYMRNQAKKHGMSVGSYLKKYLEQRRFLQRSIIINTQNDSGKKTCQLSLFGILLFLTILLRRNFENSKHIMYYYDKIASNYSGVVPLIFGKWSLLKDNLGNDSMFNFDVILSKDFRISRSSKSVILHGYKELYQSARSIIQYNFSNLRLIFDTGINSLERYEVNKLEGITRYKQVNKREKNDMTKFFALYQKLKDISEPINMRPEEISLVYYLNLIARDKYYANLDRFSMYLEESELPTTRWASIPAKQFTQILKEDREISKWFDNWKKDVIDFQHTVNEKIVEEPERTSRYEEFTPHWYEEEFGTKS
ncbi:MAG: hypothetical protein GEU26_05440 [Nitrososphaeraceae archaeon]|nr:hypothetical protein [Nitrososphaeraceae archaeon]